MEEWFWAAPRRQPAGDRFVIEAGQSRLWQRVSLEIDPNQHCSWLQINKDGELVLVEDILDMMLTVVPTYLVNQNRFVLEAAKIPVFANFLRTAQSDLCNFVSNSMHSGILATSEPYSEETKNRLGYIVSNTLKIEPDWF